jgi:hypothetical protein
MPRELFSTVHSLVVCSPHDINIMLFQRPLYFSINDQGYFLAENNGLIQAQSTMPPTGFCKM